MTTFATLKTNVSRDLRDTSNLTFSTDVVGDLINAALAEVGRLAPQRFQTDITPSANTLTYTLALPDSELKRVEIWDASTTPHRFLRLLRPLAWEYYNTSSLGWEVWNNVLSLTNRQEEALDPVKDIIRVWGYASYVPLSGTNDTVGVSNELEWAMRAYCRVEALQRLTIERDMFAQWQTHSGNSDMTPAGLLSALSLAESDWKSRARSLVILRERP